MHEVLVNRLGGLSLPRKSVVRLTDRPDMTLDVYRGRKTTNQSTINLKSKKIKNKLKTGAHLLWNNVKVEWHADNTVLLAIFLPILSFSYLFLPF